MVITFPNYRRLTKYIYNITEYARIYDFRKDGLFSLDLRLGTEDGTQSGMEP